MQGAIDTLNANMATQNHNHTQELIKCRNESAQKDLQIKGLQENIYSLLHSLNLRVVNIETVLRQQHQHPGHTPSTQHTPPQHVIATPTQHIVAPIPTQHVAASTSTQHVAAPPAAPVQVVVAPPAAPAQVVAPPAAPAQPPTRPVQPATQRTSAPPAPAGPSQPTSQHQPPSRPARGPSQQPPPARTAPSNQHTPATTVGADIGQQDQGTTDRLRDKHVKTRELFVGNLNDDMTEREMLSIISDSGIGINENQIKVENLQIRSQDKGKAFKITIPQSIYLEVWAVIGSTHRIRTHKSVIVEQFKSRKPQTTQGRQQPQNRYTRNNQRINNRGSSHQSFRSPNNQRQYQQRQYEWGYNNFGSQTMRGYQQDDIYQRNDDLYYNNRTNTYDNFNSNWNSRW